MADANDDQDDDTYQRPERKSRSVLLHGYGGAALRIFGTYTLNGEDGKPHKILVRAYHRDSAKAPWNPGATSAPTTIEDLEDEIADLVVRATAAGWKAPTRRRLSDGFSAASLPKPPTPPETRMRKKDTFTAGGIPDPLSVKHGGGGGRGRR